MPFACRNIGTNPASAWHLMVNEALVKHIQTCTVAETLITLVELDAIFSLYYTPMEH